jgi:hypothetical protein
MLIDTAALKDQLRATYRRASFANLDDPTLPLSTLEYYAGLLAQEYRDELRAIKHVEGTALRATR